ncbi:hypothetical protein [Streptomyces chromofuscus]|uniref:Uncharacterized protein n=1 Tax=Streptomyces chromofuscus TaxID=42881 RepID=A0A7M2T5X2_STRCW|nr:hypothetical protein [Streptomyces chromofuscus]QOV43283.1 hypothetical protein IPT68_26525 [Streptomyces chromofuscus]
MGEGIGRRRFEVGDVLLVSCPPALARIAEVTPSEVSVAWPWQRIDPDSEIRWNGLRAIPRVARRGEWGGLFQVEPHAGRLEAGGSCLVGIPETLVRIIDIGRFDPPADVGWLPRPHTMLIVLPLDHPRDPHAEEDGDTIDLESAAPVRIELVARD